MNIFNELEKYKQQQVHYQEPLRAVEEPKQTKNAEEIREEDIKKERLQRRGRIQETCTGVAVALVSISALLLLLFSKEAAMISFIIGIILPLVVGLVFCAWTLAKNAASSLTKTIILTILIIGAMVGGIYLISNADWGNRPRMEQIDSQRPDKF
jgi:hypothetical protein